MPSCPIAMPSSMAIVLNSAAKQPIRSISCFTNCPTSCRCVCPGTNCVNELTTATMGRPICSRFIPLAAQSALAPAMRRPCVLFELRKSILLISSVCSVVVRLWVFLMPSKGGEGSWQHVKKKALPTLDEKGPFSHKTNCQKPNRLHPSRNAIGIIMTLIDRTTESVYTDFIFILHMP